jgi:lipoprotein-anchoring transpeptidase ErfK/SrfK
VSKLGFPTRLGVTAAVAALVGVTVMIAAVVVANSGAGPAAAMPSPAKASPHSSTAIEPANAVPSISQQGQQVHSNSPVHRVPVQLVLTAQDHANCPAAATACVDLTRHISWLQAQGKVTFGPVQMEPGKPGGQHQTPSGTFQVAWKAGPTYRSSIYHDAMPWATFFAAGGIAFHGGSLTAWSHGCVHLTDANARYYNEHLPIGAQVVVF